LIFIVRFLFNDMKYLRICCWSISMLFCASQASDASHLRAGEITVERISCNGLTFRITITVYTDTGSSVRFSNDGVGVLSFGDGTFINPPQREHTVPPGVGPGIGLVKYVAPPHTFPGPGRYTITYKESYRNQEIINIARPEGTDFFLETVIIIDPFIGCDNSPQLRVPPINRGCTGKAWYHNPGAYDPDDGDLLTYELVAPKQDRGVPVNNYRDPNASEFYDRIGANYATANEDGTGPPTFSIDSVGGTILWDSPGAPGEYNIAFRIIQWRRIGGVFRQIGYVTRDMQIIIEDCRNERPELTVPQDICVEAGTTINETIFGNDPDALDELKIEAFSDVFELGSSPATYTPNPAVFQKPPRPARLSFSWATTCAHIKEQPYQVVFQVSDKSTGGPTLVQFKTWRIRVIGPKPVWKSAVVDIATRSARLEWEPYRCAGSASTMEVWRRVDSYGAEVGPCTTGMPESFGYTKIATVPIGTTRYTNGGLASGAKYCYRLVAVFPLPRGGESVVSQEICLPPFRADRAVITHATVDRTDERLGQVTVRWRSPFDIDKASFPPPYRYKVYRAEGFGGNVRLAEAFPGTRPDTVWVDTGLNTRDIVYNYRVLGFDSNGARIDSSAVASTVRLEIRPKFRELELRWAANVPWSNNTFDHPTHTVYRGPAGATEAQLAKVADVNVNQGGFVFRDENLDESQAYCYRVEARGSYGNPRIPAPLVNFSQISCAQAAIPEPPCKPIFATKLPALDCDEYRATSSCVDKRGAYSNTLNWRRPDPACAENIKGYYVYFADKIGNEFTKIKDPITGQDIFVTDTVFVHANLESFAGCYKISAVDGAGNEGELSDEVCFDNCPYYELPNVFTPNGDKCNDVFSAYSTRNIGEGGVSECEQTALSQDQVLDLQKRCARFVERVVFTVYNRWGTEVYHYESGGPRTIFGESDIYIDWDGRDNNRGELSTGIYYYKAQVTFDVVDPSRQNSTIKGWVQLIR
jgi:hypothetical protein